MKIGILTHYYKSTNYGGNLQAYALCTVLNKLGHHAEQITYDRSFDIKSSVSLGKKIRRFIYKIIVTIKKLPLFLLNLSVKSKINQRRKSVLNFNKSIPHTTVYNAKNISSATKKFDVFITGSDQVWHPSAVCDAYLLNFTNSSQNVKFSYAASISKPELDKSTIEQYCKSLSDFRAISVRETQAINILQPYVTQRIECVLDPTLLLSREDWEKIASNKFTGNNYIFCYFLGDTQTDRELANEFARKHDLPILTIPYLSDSYRKCDVNFGDILLSNVSVEDFIGLIKNAAYIFTDSFHATVFSLIFNKEFFVFDRIIGQSLGSRIRELTNLFHVSERFCNSKEKLNSDYIAAVAPIDYSKPTPEFDSALKKSFDFLLCNLSSEERKEK